MKPLAALTTAGIIAGPSYYIAHRYREVSRVAPELRNPVLFIPFAVTNSAMLKALRVVASRPTKPLDQITLTERWVTEVEMNGGRVDAAAEVQTPGLTIGPVRVFSYDPPGRSTNSGALLWIHSGGRVAGSPLSDHRICSFLAQETGALVISVDYRLAPEHPYPAGLDDVRTALRWLRTEAGELGIDTERVAIGGASAGGGLAAEVCQWAVDVGIPVAMQLLVYPMLDDRTVEPDPDGRGQFIWTAASNRFAWSSYLSHPAGEPEDRPYAVAARRGDLSGLPPAWIGVGELDLFYAEDIEYAVRLESAGVACTVDVVPGMYHGADVLGIKQPSSMRAFWQRMADALGKAIG